MALTVRLDPETEQRLAHLAKETGRTKSYYVRKLIEDYLEDLEDIYFAEQELEDVRQGKSRLISHEEVWRGLAD